MNRKVLSLTASNITVLFFSIALWKRDTYPYKVRAINDNVCQYYYNYAQIIEL